MIVEREVHTDVRALLMSNRPFQYAHLIKFERPSRPDGTTGVVSTSANRYAYFTDASRNVPFDDLSKDHTGTANGAQLYIANKLLNVTGVQESIEAKASNFTITLDGNGLGAALSGTATITVPLAGYVDIAWSTDPLLSGFREGDKVQVLAGANNNYCTVDSFRAGNITRLKIMANEGTGLIAVTTTVTMTLASEEIKSILLDKNSSSYSSFINREVYIYRAYFENGSMVGSSLDANGRYGPVLLFKGIITACGFEDTDEGIKVQWSLSSHWGDFAQVKGRVTSDEFHRALDANGLPQPASAIKPIYAYDKGFMHSETSIHMLATYFVDVEKQKVKAKNGFLGLGIGSKVKVKKYFVKEPRNSELDFQLQAKSIPLIYGVRSAGGIPIFADTLKSDSSQVYVIYALSEGQIGGIYDVYVNGKSLICGNQADYDTRHAQNSENTIDVLCNGRADRGDVLGGTNSVSSTTYDYYNTPTLERVYNLPFNWGSLRRQAEYLRPTVSATVADFPISTGSGLIHGNSITLPGSQSVTLDFFSGTSYQIAAPQLVTLAQQNAFKVQNDYWTGSNTSEYWGPNHRLLDTAYVLAKVGIKEGETTIPDLEFIVRGKALECYNYDYSYAHDAKMTSEDPNNFKLGQTITLYNASNNASMGTRQIIDKWSFYNPDGVLETRFRFDTPPVLDVENDGIPEITRFYMSNGTNNWTMVTYNYELNSGDVPAELSVAATVTNDGGYIGVTYPASTPATTGGDPNAGVAPTYSLYNGTVVSLGGALLNGGTRTTTTMRTWYTYDLVGEILV
jgi:hypothetical protein